MTKISIAFLAAMSLAGFGCHKNKGDADKAGAIAKLTELKNKMCACKDKTCSDKVSAELAAWGQEYDKPDVDKPASPDEKDSEKLEALKEETASCLLKIEVPSGAGAPGAAAAGAAGGAGGAMDRGSPAAGSAGESAAAGSNTGG
ncbi:MAG TPA: hypothetical protein VF516_24735, partial [Kofleriaceae bacterium]